MQDRLTSNLTREQALGHLGNLCPGGFYVDPRVQSPVSNHLSQVSQLFCCTKSALHFAGEKQFLIHCQNQNVGLKTIITRMSSTSTAKMIPTTVPRVESTRYSSLWGPALASTRIWRLRVGV